MRTYDYNKKWQQLLTPEIVPMLSQIHEFKGEQNLFIEAQSDALTQLVEIAKIQSTEASNKIEGIFTSDERLKKLVQTKQPQGLATSKRLQAIEMCFQPYTIVMNLYQSVLPSYCNCIVTCISSAVNLSAAHIKMRIM